MADNESSSISPLRLLLFLFLLIILPLGLGLYLAPRALPAPQVGIVRLSYDIFSLTANEITQQLAYARRDPAVKAVVLIINSPGGSAAYSEELYLDVLRARETMPVVANIDILAASGAYYMAAAADEIYAKPTSSIGSIGVIASLPGPVFIEDNLVTSGPYKAFGGTQDGFVRQVEMAKFAFLGAIEQGRGDRLTVDSAVLSRAEIYTGVQAEAMGLIDGLRSTDEAIARAAELAGLRNYEVVELYPLVFDGGGSSTIYGRYTPPPLDLQQLWAQPVGLPTGIYYRHIEPGQ
jgi:protease-4